MSDVEEDNVRERTVTVGCLSYTGSGAVENSDILRGGLESVAEVGQERAQTRGEGRDDCGVVLPALHSSAHSQLQMTIFIQHLKRKSVSQYSVTDITMCSVTLQSAKVCSRSQSECG